MSTTLDNFVKAALSADHSKRYIEECADYILRLEEFGYLPLFSLVHLAIEMGVKSDMLRILIRDGSKKYSYFRLRKKKGGFREIMCPHEDLKYVQRWLLINILSKYPLTQSCNSFRQGFSPVTNAGIHSMKKFVLRIDLLKFYDTITEFRVAGVFSSMGYLPNLSIDMAKLVTARHRNSYWDSFSKLEKHTLRDLCVSRPAILPQGAPSSPMISNIVASRLDKRLQGLADSLACNYSRYADDLTFSSDYHEILPDGELVREIVEDEGFFVNDEKTLLSKHGTKQYVTGLTITHGVHISKRYRREIFSHLHFARKFGPVDHLKRWSVRKGIKKDLYAFQDWLLGSICYVLSVDKKNGAKMLQEFNKIDWAI